MNQSEDRAPAKLSSELLESSNEVLMRLYQQGQINAFDELYRRHSPKVYGYLHSRTSSRQQSDDLLQACFLKLHQSRHQYDPAQEFLPWFWSILRSVFADSLRRDAKNPARANPSEADSSRTLENIPATRELEEDPASVASELLARLPEDQRQLIEMRTKHELSFEEIASRLAITPATARQRFSRLIRSLKERLS